MGPYMSFVYRRFAAFLLVALGAVATGSSASVYSPTSILIKNVTVIDPNRREALPGRSVFIQEGRIVAVERSRRRSPAARTVIDGSGRYLIPGLMDMHVHLFLGQEQTPTLQLLVANGVTGIREMSADCYDAAGSKRGCVEQYKALQLDVRAGRVVGPDVVELASAMVMGPTRLKLPAAAPAWVAPSTPEQMRTNMEHLASRGVQLVKTHDSIPSAAFSVLMEESNRRGLKVGGHVPFGAGSLGAARMGYDSIEHARDLLYDCSDYGSQYRQREASFANGDPGASRPPNLERLQQTVAQYDPRQCRKVLRKLAATGVFYAPTHVTREMEARASNPVYRADPSWMFIAPERRARWQKDIDETAALPSSERAALTAFYRHGLKITKLAFEAGVPIMAGTDASDTAIVPGYSLHRELGLLAQAGLTPMEVLKTATTVPARYLKRSDLGGIAPGKRADLVLLSRNPLVDVANTSSIEEVILAGRRFDRAQLDALLVDARKMAAAH